MASPTPSDVRTIRYKLRFNPQTEQEFLIELDGKTLALVPRPRTTYPEWTDLKCQQCANCPLDPKQHPRCPVAANMVDMVNYFCQPQPAKDLDVWIETPERTYHKHVDIKIAAFSLMGIYMATSGCPIMDKLRPMARYHLPFATATETTYRSISNYLVAQYLLARNGQPPDWDLKNLGPLYEGIETVNQYFRERLQAVSQHNYALTALLQLDSFASYINISLNQDAFFNLEQMFNKEFSSEAAAPAQASQPVSDAEKLSYQYTFQREGQEEKSFTIYIHRETLNLISVPAEPLPSWTQLSCEKCPNCPLNEERHPYCPAALGVSETMEFFKKTASIQEAVITVKTENRSYVKKGAVPAGISSMMGLIMASSGCPILGKLKPLARNHLPFATSRETAYRSLGMYLLSQYFQKKNGGTPDWHLSHFTKLYEEINTINRAFSSRLRQIDNMEDAGINALVQLDCFAQHINFTFTEGHIQEFQHLFRAYFD